MFASIHSATVVGVDAVPVMVEVDVAAGLQKVQLVGLPEGAVRESRVRVRSSMENAGYLFPAGQINVNLAPADIRKEGTLFDLPIAIAILAADGVLNEQALERARQYLIAGELSLEGQVRSIRGVLPLTLSARAQGLRGVIVPHENMEEAALVVDAEVVGARSLSEALQFLQQRGDAEVRRAPRAVETVMTEICHLADFSEVRGQHRARRALEIAAAGGHNLLMLGPPGSGKTMLARRFPSIMPAMTFEEALETTRVYSVSGLTKPLRGLLTERPFRAPHHTISEVGMVGGGSGLPRPGEVSLAHNGVLFLDELPEFRRSVLEVLRQPLEDGFVSITRSLVTVDYPARLMLVASMNPCPCGHLGDTRHACRCHPQEIQRYRGRISGPLMDRIDLHVEVAAVDYSALKTPTPSESSATIRGRVEAARAVQRQRFGGAGFHCNAHMGAADLRVHCELDDDGHALLAAAMDRLGLSARAWARVLKVARTIADLEGAPQIRRAHVAEAIQLRSLDRSQAPHRRDRPVVASVLGKTERTDSGSP